AYCQDNEISWLDCRHLDMAAGRELAQFVSRADHLRQRHPSLRLARFLDNKAEVARGVKRIKWYDLDGSLMSDSAWEFAEGRVLGLQSACLCNDAGLDVSLLLVNAADTDVDFTLPQSSWPWERVLDSSSLRAAPVAVQTPTVRVCAHGLLLLVAK